MYAGSKVQKLHHICDTILSRKIGVGNEAAVTSGKYVPNDMQSASAYFKRKLYENRVVATVTKDNSQMKMGIRSSSMPSSYWAIFNDFRLYFYGKMSEDILLGIETLKTNGQKSAVRQGVYTLDGRRLSPDAQLRPGLYLIDGRKVVVK